MESYGRGLEVLSLGGCRALVKAKTVDCIRGRCKSLVGLDLSGTLAAGTTDASLLRRDALSEVLAVGWRAWVRRRRRRLG